jgi:hypothetical protein
MFSLIDLPDNRWAVAWPAFGKVHTVDNIRLMIKFAIDAGAVEVSIVGDNGVVLSLDAYAYLQMQDDIETEYLIKDVGPVVGLRVETYAQAVEVVDRMEKYIVWKQLSKKNGVIM